MTAASPAPVPGTILVPLDGSTMAEQALPVAAAIARRTGASLDLATVHVPLPALMAMEQDIPADGELERELWQQQCAYITSAATAIQTAHGVEAASAILDVHGTVAKTLADHAQAKAAGLIVMTTHGHGGVSRFWLGSVADRLLRRAQIPVLLLRPQNGPPHTEFRRVVIALDGSAESERALAPALALTAHTRDVQYTLVRVAEPPAAVITRMALQPAHMPPHWREQQENAAHVYLERLSERLRGEGREVSSETIAARGIAEQITGLAHRVAADLIVVGTHAARGLDRLLLGSVADKVVRGAAQPVLVVPTSPPAEDAAANGQGLNRDEQRS